MIAENDSTRIRQVTIKTKRGEVRQKVASDGTVLASSARPVPGSKTRFLISSYKQMGYESFGDKVATYNIPVKDKCDPDLIVRVIRKLVKDNPHLPYLSVEVGITVQSDDDKTPSMFLPAPNTAIWQTTAWNYTEERRFFNADLNDRAERTAASIFTASSDTFSHISMIMIRMVALQ